MTVYRPSISFSFEVKGYGTVTFPVAVEYDGPTGQWASFCLTLEIATCADSLDDAVTQLAELAPVFLALHEQHGQLDRVMSEAGYEKERGD